MNLMNLMFSYLYAFITEHGSMEDAARQLLAHMNRLTNLFCVF